MTLKPSLKLIRVSVNDQPTEQKAEALCGLHWAVLNQPPSKEENAFYESAAAAPEDFRDVLAFTKVSLAVRLLNDPDFVERAEKFQREWNAALEASDAAAPAVDSEAAKK